jgi:hypothetical protein
MTRRKRKRRRKKIILLYSVCKSDNLLKPTGYVMQKQV